MSNQGISGPALIVRHTGQLFSLVQVPVTIGRGNENTIILADPEVSRRHAAILWQSGTYVVQDVGSAKGTYVNERRISGPQPLRHGSVLRVGDTLFDVQMPARTDGSSPRPEGTERVVDPPSEAVSRRPALPVIIGLMLGGFVVVCLVTALILFLLDRRRGEPSVALQWPRDGAQLILGQPILLEATATGARDVTRLDLSVDGVVVASAASSSAKGQASLTATQSWTFAEAGPHVVSAVAATARNRVTTPVSHQVTVLGEGGSATPTVSATPTLGGPTETPTPTATWTLTPTSTLSPTPTTTELPLPSIEFFRARPASINAGECTMLEWGQVTHAAAATIDHGIGGVGTPGSRQICPPETTTYVMTASGANGVATASATVTVNPAKADLTVEAITFTPNPPVEGQDALVRITMRNIGGGPAGPFDWQWQPGTAPAFNGQAPGGLKAGEAIDVTVTWRPDTWYADLATIARADTSNAVPESNENNNQLQVNVQVVRPSGETVSLASQAALDGYVVQGQVANNRTDIRMGNVPAAGGDNIYRGFLSFDLSGIPAGATIQSVELRFWQQIIEGDPYGKLGALVLKHVDYGPGLEVAAFDAPELGSTVLPALTAPEVTYVVAGDPLIAWIQQDLAAGRGRFQLRLQFASERDGDDAQDYIRVESGDNFFGQGKVPVVRITYQP